MVALLIVLAVLVAGVAGYHAGRRAAERERPAETPEEARLKRQVGDMKEELRQAKGELERETAAAAQIPFVVKRFGEPLAKAAIPGLTLKVLRDVFGTPSAAFLLIRDGNLVLVDGAGLPPEIRTGREFSSTAGILGRVMERHAAVSKEEYLGGLPEWPLPPRTLEEAGVRADLAAPLAWGGTVRGALVVAGAPGSLDRKLPYMAMMGDLVASALKNAIALKDLDRQASTDSLTGLANRGHFIPRFNAMVREARERRESLSVVLFDIDHFKKVNDTHGHPAGDAVLRHLSEIVRANRRDGELDLPARYGGEEFIVALGAAGKEPAMRFAETLRGVVAATPFPVAGRETPLRVTISAGVASYPEDGDSPTALIMAADEALYEAKRSGRNRVVRALHVALDGRPV